jgi:hypothetical protein
MKYCLLCDTEYLDHVTVCAEDGEPLVERDTYDRVRKTDDQLSGPLRVLRVLEGPFHADTVRDVLETEQIPHAIHSNVDTAYGRIFMPGKGWGEALVLAADYDRADRAVRAVMESLLEAKGNGNADPVVD